MAVCWPTRHKQIVSVGLLFLLIVIVIHPLLDIPNSRLVPGHVQLSFAVIGYTPPQMVLTPHVCQWSISAPHRTVSKAFSPLLC